MALQRTVGNRATGQAMAQAQASNGHSETVTLPLEGVTHPVAESLDNPNLKFRVPGFSDVKRIYGDKTLRIDTAVIKDRVGQLLRRMEREKRLKTKDDVPTILKKIFPGKGKVNEAAFNAALDVGDRSVIYETALDAETTVKAADRAKLKTAMREAGAIIKNAESDTLGLKQVFGKKHRVAKARYAKARSALRNVAKDMDAHVSTDYNLDDPEVNLGGWADHGAQHMHLLASVVKLIDAPETKATLIHESAHLGHTKVDDHGYYGTPGFEAMTEIDKVNNAGHYEELPRRQMGISDFDGHTFTAGKKKGGGVVTWEDKVRRKVSEHFRKSWDAAVDTHTWLRGVHIAGLAGDTTPFDDERALIMEVSKLMDLTVHEQAAGHQKITKLDVTLTESIARGVAIVGGLARKMPMPELYGPWPDDKYRDEMHGYALTNAALAKYGSLLGDRDRNLKLLNWLVKNYRSLP